MPREDPKLVTVVMPAFDSGRHIEQAIQSVLSQSYSNWELLVVDGGSIDATRNIVRAYARIDHRIKLIENINDCGPAHARCTGIRGGMGDYIAFLDADDYWLPNKLQEQIGFMTANCENFCYSHYRSVSNDGTQVGCLVPMRFEFDFQAGLRHRGIGTLTVVIRRDLLTDDVISIWRKAGGEELLWWLLILKKGGRARLLPKDLARYRDTAGSLSKNRIYTLRSVWNMYRHDIGLGRFETASHYVSYLFDSAIRKIRIRMCSMLIKQISRQPIK